MPKLTLLDSGANWTYERTLRARLNIEDLLYQENSGFSLEVGVRGRVECVALVYLLSLFLSFSLLTLTLLQFETSVSFCFFFLQVWAQADRAIPLPYSCMNYFSLTLGHGLLHLEAKLVRQETRYPLETLPLSQQRVKNERTRQ